MVVNGKLTRNVLETSVTAVPEGLRQVLARSAAGEHLPDLFLQILIALGHRQRRHGAGGGLAAAIPHQFRQGVCRSFRETWSNFRYLMASARKPVRVSTACLLVAGIAGAGSLLLLRGFGPQQLPNYLTAITVDYPSEGSIFPPEITPPTFLWRDPSGTATSTLHGCR